MRAGRGIFQRTVFLQHGASVGRVGDAEFVQLCERIIVHLPAGGPMRNRCVAEDVMEARIRTLHDFLRPRRVADAYIVLPDAVVPGVDAAFEVGITYRTPV